MPEIVTLPSGNMVTLRDPDQTTERQRRPVRTAQLRAGLNAQTLQAAINGDHIDMTDDQIESLWAIADAMVMALVESWTFELPTSIEGLHSIPGEKDYRAILDACEKHRDVLLPNFDPTPDADSPTEPSTA